MNLQRAGGGVKSFSIERDAWGHLEVSFSPERMRTYLVAMNGDREKALDLYTWNTALCAAFYGPLQGLEVALRNAMHRQLTARYGSAWYDNLAAGLDTGCLDRIAAAKYEIERSGRAARSGRIVAGLSFGFWVSLLRSGGRIDSVGRKADYEATLWRPALRGAFPHRESLTRKQVHGLLEHLRTLRNRIAHHEPVFGRQLDKDYQSILDVTDWISPEVRAWIERYSRVPTLLAGELTDVQF